MLEMLANLKEGFEMIQNHRYYEENTSIEQYCLDLQKAGIEFSEEAIVQKYKELENFSEVMDYFYYKDEARWNMIDERRNAQFNSDSQFYYITKIIENNFDTNQVLIHILLMKPCVR